MARKEPPAQDAASDAARSWRDLAVARSLDSARVRAEQRVQRFLDAALELMSSSDDKDFTVQEVVERSGQSLRSFYQYFAGKYELLLALFEESVRLTAEQLRTLVHDEAEPLARLHRFTIEYYAMCQPPPHSRTATKRLVTTPMAEFAQRLMTEHPKEAAQAYAPVASLLEELLDDAAAAGAIRSELDNRRIAGVVLQAIMFNIFSTTISGSPLRANSDPAEELWALIAAGIAA